MGKTMWYINRLKAMSFREVMWRISQKRLQEKEKKIFKKQSITVTATVFDKKLKCLIFSPDNIGLNFANAFYDLKQAIHLLGNYDYDDYKEKWHAGFQTHRDWDLDFSYSLNYKQRDDIGDARTNWELNRHFQFVLLAKAYYVTNERKYAEELEFLFQDWNRRNPFLQGISWTSVMEVAIRCIQWCMTLAFLQKKGYVSNSDLLQNLDSGIKNMTAYIVRHYSRFSSANNHLLVEATAIAYAGFAYNNSEWKQLAIRILTEELMKQNYQDGVNKEMSLHYQTFGMEAYALVMQLMQKAGMTVPAMWNDMLSKQCEFVRCSMVNETSACEFGDNDEGKILDIEGGKISHYRYLLQLCSMVLGKRYESFENISETISWLFTQEEIAYCKSLLFQKISDSRTFIEGGYSFLRSKNGEIVIGIDHAPLGFGSIAAHGHADALSFQLYVDGKCFLGDPGTYIYHCNLSKRNDYRRSCNHNTVWIENDEQSQMMGAFLWGRKAKTFLLDKYLNKEIDWLQAECDWQNGIKHIRSFKFDKEGFLEINDSLEASDNGYATLIVHPLCNVTFKDGVAIVERDNVAIKIKSEVEAKLYDTWYSEEYGKEQKTKKIVYKLSNNKLKTTIWIEKY